MISETKHLAKAIQNRKKQKMAAEKYDASKIKVLEGLEGIRKRFDVVELSRRIKKKGDTKKLIEIIKSFIPNSMLYKIGGIK